MTALTVNGVYPIDYFTLGGVDEIQYPDTFWWSSKQRFAAVDDVGNFLSFANGGTLTSEILELDLGRTRGLNFINFDVLRAPIDMTIEYDSVSLADGTHTWVKVKRMENQPFDDQVIFDANARNPWQNVNFYFTDPQDNFVFTRYVRITFTRRDEGWPTDNSTAFRWPIFVKQMRLARYVSGIYDTAGLLVANVPDDPDLLTLPLSDPATTYEIRQQFVLPIDSARGNLTPTLLAFSVLVNVDTSPVGVATFDALNPTFAWSLYDVTGTNPALVERGNVEGAINNGQTWVNFNLANPFDGDLSKIYELRIASTNAQLCSQVYVHDLNILSSRSVPGTLGFTNNNTNVVTTSNTTSVLGAGTFIQRVDSPEQVYGVNASTNTTLTLVSPYPGATQSGVSVSRVFPMTIWQNGVYVQDATRHLVIRVFADVAEEGRDVLGNAYRYGTHRDRAEYVFDNTRAGWMSAPQPSPDAVEALYFDVRSKDTDGNAIYSLLDSINIAPRTLGVVMNVYWTKEGLNGDKPKSINDWDYMLWEPISQSYVLRKNAIFRLPHLIRASFVKLEFTNLNPMPWHVPTYPDLPPVLYRRFPTWVEAQFNNPAIQRTVSDWFAANATPVQTQVLSALADPIKEFEYKQSEFLEALALGEVSDQQGVNSGLIDVANRALIDPTTASKIFVSLDNMYADTLLLTVDQDTTLGKVVVGRYDSRLITDPLETSPSSTNQDIPFVSTINDRVGESYSHLAQTPMRFMQTSRHAYRVEQARFNKKAYFAGVKHVQFLRSDPTATHDDVVITDVLFDDELLAINTWSPIEETSITDGQTVFVSYQVGEDFFTDEALVLTANTTVLLANGGANAFNIKVFQMKGQQGIQYYQDDDFVLSYQYDDLGRTVTAIARSSLSQRLGVERLPLRTVDAGLVIGVALIPRQPTDDLATVIGVASISAGFEGPAVPSYGDSTYGAGTFGHPGGTYTETTLVTGTSVVTGINVIVAVDAATVSGIAVPSATGA